MEYKEEIEKSGRVFENLIEYIGESSINQKEPVKPVFKTEDFCLYNDDCLKVMAKFPDNYVDMIYGDPDYNVGINYAGNN